jgi:hypothetical protein
MRQFDDMLDSSTLNKNGARELLMQERTIVEPGLVGDLQVTGDSPIRHHWLAQFFDNERRYYSGEALNVVKELYQSAWEDVERRGRLLSQKEMDSLLYKKAICFFKLYFILSGFDLGGRIDDFSYLLGMGLGMLDDILDAAQDYQSDYVNVTREELIALGVDLEPEDQGFLTRLIERGYLTYKAKRIMSVLLKARRMARHIRVPVVRAFLLRLTEIFAAPILEGRFVPGQRYFFRGGRLADMLLPDNESIAYRMGHSMIGVFLSFPQVFSSLFSRVPAI